jgi:hypothetical protein
MTRLKGLLALALLTLGTTANNARAVDPSGGIFFSPPFTYAGYVFPGHYYTAPTFYYPSMNWYASYNPYYYPSYYYTPTFYPSYSYPTYYYRYAE